MNHNLIAWRIAFIVLFIAGIKLYLSGVDGRFGIEVPKSVGILLSLIAAVQFIFSFSKKKKNDLKEKMMICKKCKKKYKKAHVEIPVCPKCDGKLVEYSTH